MSISSMFNVTRRALTAHQSAMDTTAKNIANINTDGYKRRRASLSALDLYKNGSGSTGFTQGNMARIRQRFVENQLSYENQNLGKHKMDNMIMTQVENILGEPSESGLINVISEFWNSWNELANDPESQYARTIVHDKGVVLAGTFNRIHSDLTRLNQQINNDIHEKATQVNQIINQIKSVNKQVSVNYSDDLMDQRDLLITKLTSLINIDTRESPGGGITISTGGQVLVSNEYINELTVSNSTENGVSITDIRLSDGNHPININSGELGSLIEISNTNIPDYIDRLNTLARSVAEQVNVIHSKGYSLDGATGINFFSDSVTDAGDFKVSDDVLNHSSVIASAESLDKPGDGSIAQDIFDLQFYQFVQGNTVFDFHNSTVGQIGSKVQESGFLSRSAEMVVQNLQNQRDSVSGVSLDEEMTNLMKHEQAYQAAARMVATVDDLMQTILNML